MDVKRVCIIGAGVSGLVSIKTCLEEGLEPVCFERDQELGGVWIWRDEIDTGKGSALYDSVVTNFSKEMMCFSDFPFPDATPPYLPGKAVIKYYQDYAEHFKLRPHIRFDSEITWVAQNDDYEETGRWRVTVRSDGGETDHVFDAVICATVFFRVPSQPVYPGEEGFEGSIIHSNEYRGSGNYQSKRVVVVGGSHSAGDIAVDTSLVAKQVYLSMRGGTLLIRRVGPLGYPHDMFANRRINFLLPERYLQHKASENDGTLDTLGLISEREGGGGGFRSSAMVNDVIESRIICGKVQTRPSLDHFTRKGVVFTDGIEVEADAVVYATGYNMKIPFMDRSVVQDNLKDLELFKRVFPPRLSHPSCAFIGYTCTRGAHAPLSEMQSRWVTRVFKGICRLPSIDHMLDDVRIVTQSSFERYGKHTILFQPLPYTDDLAARIGVLPTFSELIFRDPVLAFHAIFSAAVPYMYRLLGPHAWKGARAACLRSLSVNREATRTRKVQKIGGGNGLLSIRLAAQLIAIFAIALLLK